MLQIKVHYIIILNSILRFKSIIISENYILKGSGPGHFTLLSPVIREEGKRYFHPHFGFAYKAVNAKVSVYYIGLGSSFLDFEYFYEETNTNWQYYFKDLSQVSFLSKHFYVDERLVKCTY